MKKFSLTILSLAILFAFAASSQAKPPKRDKGKMIEYKNEFWEKIKKSALEFAKPKEKPKLSFKMDFSGYDLPKSIDEFTAYWHNPPISQGWTGTCWDFSTTSFLESEIYRIHKKKLKISEIFTAYWEYVEKARRFVRERGASAFAEGSESDGVLKTWKKYGCVPESVYTGLKKGQKFHDHHKMFAEMKNFLDFVKEKDFWNEEVVLSTIKSIMNKYLGTPPEKFEYEGKTYDPKSFLAEVVKIDPDDYVTVMSLMQEPWYKKTIYDVPDNWRRSADYYNVPIEDFMSALKKAVVNGYTVAIGGDVSESGYDSHKEVAVVPTYDIPYEYIDDNARQFRFSDKTTQDDHGIHIVGYKKDKNGMYWFLIKDSGSGSRNGKNKGYYFYREDYVKLKMLTFTVAKEAIKDLLKKFK